MVTTVSGHARDHAGATSSSILTFPQPCPDCAGPYGTPHLVTAAVVQDSIRLGMGCAGCGHEWLLELPLLTAEQPAELRELTPA